MGRSTSINTSTAIDNRLAVTDNAFGLSSSGTGNNTALQGDIFNLSASGFGGGKAGGGQGGTINLTTQSLDGGAIDSAFNFAKNANNNAFNFAGFSLSSVLDSVINGQKLNQSAAQYTADAIGSAVRDAGASSAAGNAYVGAALNGLGQATTAAAVGQAAQAELEKAERAALIKKLVIGAAVLGAGWYFLKGRK